MKHKQIKRPINVRLLIMLLPLLMGVLIMFGLFCNTLYHKKIEQEIRSQLQLQVDAVAHQLDTTLSEINRLSVLVYANTNVREGLQKAFSEDFTFNDRVDLHKNVLDSLLTLTESPSMYSVWLFPVSSNIFCDQKHIYSSQYFPDQELLTYLIEDPDSFGKTFYHCDLIKYYWVQDAARPYLNDALFISRTMYNSAREPMAVLSGVVYLDHLRSILNTIAPKDESFCYTLSRSDGQPLFDSGEWQDDMLVISSTITTGWLHLQIGFASSTLAQQTAEQTRMLLIFGAIMLLIAAGLIYLVCRRVMNPLHNVVRKFSNLKIGTPLIEDPLTSQDEAALIDQTFTNVYRKYYKSVQEQNKLEENQRRLEINLLLARINPHFLYNTLSVLRWSMAPEERHIVDRLVAYYRSMLGKGRDIASLAQEVELIDQYIDLQRYTYSKKIDFNCLIESNIEMLMIPKFLLQPIIENSVKLSTSETPVSITLSAKQENNNLIISIENNAEPIQEDAMLWLNALNEQDRPHLLRTVSSHEEPRGYGIFNVIMRIRLLCGSGYGLWHEHPESGGTRARFVLPVTRDAAFFLHSKKES